MRETSSTTSSETQGNIAEAAFFRHDVASEDNWEHVVDAAQGTFGTPDILVNNAGIYRIEPIDEISLED
jgi:NAD(P)-dependent dehydrogenase (short-subunit alcohol dehydrogenase family)